MKIYTKSGDKGKTSLYTGERILKNDPLIEAIGTVDECNSFLGLALAFFPANQPSHQQLKKELITIQHALFDLGAALATPRTRAAQKSLENTRFDEKGTALLEEWIDHMEALLPKLKNFILPGGSQAGAFLHVARSVCRRAERIVIPLNTQADVSDHVMVFLNRLSDYLFVASRYANFLDQQQEVPWKHSIVDSI